MNTITKHSGRLALLVMALYFIVPSPSAMGKTIRIDGSSTVYPIVEAVAEEFQKLKKGSVRITVGISGTGGGFRKFNRGEIDIASASRPIMPKEVEAAKAAGIEYFELPVAYDGIAVMVNPKNNWITSINLAELKRIWQPEATGKITRWNQINKDWPDLSLKLYGAGVDSGTFDYFTEVVVGKAKASRSDFTSSEDDNVLVQGIAMDKGALGFFGYGYYAENKDKLKLLAVDGGKGGVLPNDKTVMEGTYHPLSRPLFIYLSRKSATRPEVKEFVEYFLKNAPVLVRQAKYIPLPPQAYSMALARYSRFVSERP